MTSVGIPSPLRIPSPNLASPSRQNLTSKRRGLEGRRFFPVGTSATWGAVFFGDLERNTGKKQILTRLTRSFNPWKVCEHFRVVCFLEEKIGWINLLCYFCLGIQSLFENGFMEPKYFAFRRWLDTPIVP